MFLLMYNRRCEVVGGVDRRMHGYIHLVSDIGVHSSGYMYIHRCMISVLMVDTP